MTDAWFGATFAGAVLGGLTVPALIAWGLLQLRRLDVRSAQLLSVGALSGMAAGGLTVLATLRWDAWALAPALLVWSLALVAAACCDGVTQRVPTPLVRQTTIATLALLTSGFALRRDWTGVLISVIAAAASGLTLTLCWRFAGAGFGDVRLAVLGGLGLGHANPRGLLLALAALMLIVLAQTTITLHRDGDRRTRFPYGPALAVGFLLAGTV